MPDRGLRANRRTGGETKVQSNLVCQPVSLGAPQRAHIVMLSKVTTRAHKAACLQTARSLHLLRKYRASETTTPL